MNADEIAAYEAHRDFTGKPFRSACYAGYTSMVFDSIGRVRICCVNSEYILGDVSKERLDDIWNGPRMQRIRDALNRYDFNFGCTICRHKILAGVIEGSTITQTQLIPLKYEEFKIETEPPFWPKHLEFHLSNKCNLQCVTCFGEFSSIIREKRDKLPPYPAAYNDQFFDDLRKYLPHLEAAQFLGGEPFVIPEMYRVWNMMIEDGLKPNCHVTTNGTVFGPDVERILESLPISISVSMDGATKETFESIRVNAKFERVIRNFRKFKEVCRARGRSIGINFTLSRMNWHELVEFLIFADAEGVDVSASEVYFPESMSLFSMEPDELRRVVDSMEDQLVNAGSAITRNRKLIENRIRELRHHLANLDERHAHYVPSMVDAFRGTKAGPETLLVSRAEAIRRLQTWNPGGSIDEIVADASDQIVEADLAPGSRFISADTIIGKTFADFVGLLFQQFGSNVVNVTMDKDLSHEDRTVRLEGGDYPATLMRVIIVPRFGADGELAGARAFFAHRPAELAVSQ